ncbi:MAG: LPS-assembly protein LptD [Robiginitomaculum sp.]|nr:LPS-assembly protein LptD [Robiginitomaculum sp.]
MLKQKITYLGVLHALYLCGVIAFSTSQFAHAQLDSFTRSGDDLKLAANSPFRDPDIIYLEADELINDQKNNTLTARGNVEGRYQDKTLRADIGKYDISTGQVIAIGNVQLINADGSAQFAEKLELSGALEAGTATNFTARFPQGGQIGSAFAARNSQNGVELYNAYFTACEACEKNGKTQKPTWRIKARKVTQDESTKSIRYRDAVFEFKGIPLFYSPYLAHPDPSVGRASGFLVPFGGISGSKGFNVKTPYYFALTPYSELTLTPYMYSKVNPLLHGQFSKAFHTGKVNIEGSATYGKFFTSDGNFFNSNTVFITSFDDLLEKKFRSHIFADGQFDINKQWQWGFQGGYAADDDYLNRYDLQEKQTELGLYTAASRRLIQQAFIVGQGDDFRFSTSAFGFSSLRSALQEEPLLDALNLIVRDPITNEIITDPNTLRLISEDDDALPIIAPKIELTKYFYDPAFGGRLKLFGDMTALTRKNTILGGTEAASTYIRATGGLDWQRNLVTTAGIEIKPFVNAKYDYFKLGAKNEQTLEFTRGTGQIGADIRWPFLKTGEKVNWILEPRIQVTQNIGDGQSSRFSVTKANNTVVNLVQDSIGVDLDKDLLFSRNKSTGYDIWQEGFRADVGASVSAHWGEDNRAMIFAGQSYYSGSDNAFIADSGLQSDTSDLVGQVEVNIGPNFSTTTRLRYDDNANILRRIDTGLSYTFDRLNTNVRYFKLNPLTPVTPAGPDEFNSPLEEISGQATVRLFDNWSTRYELHRDLSNDLTRRQALSLIFDDDCTRIELIYSKSNNGLGLIRQSDGLSLRISLLSLGASKAR